MVKKANDPYYLDSPSKKTNEDNNENSDTFDVDKIPIRMLRKSDLQSNSTSRHKKNKRSKIKYVVMDEEELPDGADDSDDVSEVDTNDKKNNESDLGLADIDVTVPLHADEVIPTLSHRKTKEIPDEKNESKMSRKKKKNKKKDKKKKRKVKNDSNESNNNILDINTTSIQNDSKSTNFLDDFMDDDDNNKDVSKQTENESAWEMNDLDNLIGIGTDSTQTAPKHDDNSGKNSNTKKKDKKSKKEKKKKKDKKKKDKKKKNKGDTSSVNLLT